MTEAAASWLTVAWASTIQCIQAQSIVGTLCKGISTFEEVILFAVSLPPEAVCLDDAIVLLRNVILTCPRTS